jgi:hypothetical protein
VSRWIASEILVRTIGELKLKPPMLTREQETALAEAKRALKNE